MSFLTTTIRKLNGFVSTIMGLKDAMPTISSIALCGNSLVRKWVKASSFLLRKDEDRALADLCYERHFSLAVLFQALNGLICATISSFHYKFSYLCSQIALA